MPVVDVYNTSNETVSQLELADDIYSVPVKSCVLHDVVTAQLAARRSGTASVKNRSDIRGSTRKLFRQKGTGRARRGDIKSPLLRGGGVVFGPQNRSYAKRLPKKVRRLALKMALSSKYAARELTVLDGFDLPEIRTRNFVQVINRFGFQKVLIVTSENDTNLELSSRNVPNVKVLRSEGLNVYDVLKYDQLLLLAPAVKLIEERLLT